MADKKKSKKGRKCSIETHPDSYEIKKALINGVPLVELEKRYGLSRPALHRYKETKLHETLVKGISYDIPIADRRLTRLHMNNERKLVENSNDMIKVIQTNIDRSMQISDSLHDAMLDPDNSQRYIVSGNINRMHALLKTSDAVVRQFTIIIEAFRASEATKTSFLHTPEWHQIISIINEEVKDVTTRERIADRLRDISYSL